MGMKRQRAGYPLASVPGIERTIINGKDGMRWHVSIEHCR